MTARPLARFRTAREALLAQATDGADAARRLSDLVDEAVLELAEHASSRTRARFALFAVGGYGAGRMLPHSDVDLLVVTDGDHKEVGPALQALLYPLWDAGLQVGHQVRAVHQQVRILSEELDAATAFLTARMLTGDERLASQTIASGFRRLRRDARRLLDRISARERPGSPFLLEPDLKEGAGGQRDLDELAWRAAIVAGAPAPDARPLVSAGYLAPEEARALGEAQALVTAARWHVQARSRRPTNRLSLEAAEEAGLDADALQRALATVADQLATVRERMSGGSDPSTQRLDLASLRELAARGEEGLAALELAATRGQLDDWLPGFSTLMTLRRPGLSHRYTVGAHSLRTAAIAASTSGGPDEAQLASVEADALLVAALAHDAGKRDGVPGHAVRGAETARAAAERLGMPAEVGTMAAALVREHLLLGDVATRADLDDEDVVLSAAARIGDRRLVRLLFALSAADMQATGPGVWTPWRATLIAELARKLEAALSPEVDGAGIVAQARHARAEALRMAAAAGASRTAIEFVAGAPLHYLARRTPIEVLRDARLAQRLAGPGAGCEVALTIDPGPAERTQLVRVATRDRRGLFATITGTLELAGFTVLSAEVYTTQRGIALDSFVVAPATLAHPDETAWRAVRRRLVKALSGAYDIETALMERRGHYARPASSARQPVSVTLARNGGALVGVHVRAPDRIGLLHDLAHAFEREGLDIRRAVVTTANGMADDVFHVTDATGQPLALETLRATLVPLLASVARAQRD